MEVANQNLLITDQKKEQKMFKILAIDGGGIKGLYSATVLAKLEEVYDCKISDHFDLICGTSTGGIIALAASLKIPMSKICEFYIQYGADIFNENCKKNKLGRLRLKIKQFIDGGKYTSKELRNALITVFGETTLAESNNLLCIPSYNITTATPRVFKKDYGCCTEDDTKKYVDIALATAAAPTYFPVKEINDHQYIDGGVWANNPAIVGLTEYMYKFANNEDYNGVEILSVSSLIIPTGKIHSSNNRSFWDWKDSLFDTFTVSQSHFTDFFLQQLSQTSFLPITYTRITHEALSAPQLSIIDMDSANNDTLKLLSAIGTRTGIKYKDNNSIKKFFTEKKSYTINKIENGK